MAIYEQEFLRPGSYELGGGATRTLTAEELARIQRNTQALLETGYEIPVLLRHPTAGSSAGGPRLAEEQPAPIAAEAAVDLSAPAAPDDAFPAPLGRLVGLRQAEGGALIHQLELPYDDEAELVEGVGLRYTSPEIRETFLDAAGQERGPIIAHIALTSRPRVADQPPLALAAGAMRLSLSDLNDTAEPPAVPVAHPVVEAEVVAQVAGEEAAALVSEQERNFRTELAERIRGSRRLPPGLRQRLAETVGAVQLSRDGDEEPSLKLSDAVALLEEALPEHLALAGDRSRLAEHPEGERFFTGERGPLTDEEATRLAREQLLSTGFARRE